MDYDVGIVRRRTIIPPAECFFAKPAAASGPSFLLDAIGVSAARAYSMRKLRSAYAGAAIRVRESGGNTQQDIGFDGSGNLDTAALVSFVGSNSGFLTKWYDQSGNADDLVQATTANQPRIVGSGTLDTRNSVPCAFNHLPSTTISMAGAASLTNAEASVVLAVNDTNWTDFSGVLTNTANPGIAFLGDGGGSTDFFAGGDFGSSIFVDGASNATKFSGTLQQVDGNGAGVSWANGPQIFQDRSNSRSLVGWLGETIIFSSALTSGNRASLRSNTKTYWGTA